MSVVTKRKVATTRNEYLVPQPAAYGDVREAMQFALRDKDDAGYETSYDDSLMVTHSHENIIVYWEEVAK